MSGVVDILRGLAKLMGIGLPEIFDAPFLSTNISEFWRRWNMPIMKWLYEESFSRISFALRKWGIVGIAIACMLTFVGSGIAHGLNLSMLLWGVSQVVPFLIHLETRNKLRKWSKNHGNPRWIAFSGWFVTIHVIILSWAFIGTGSVRESISMLKALLHGPIWPAWGGEIHWLQILTACGFGLALQFIPHFKGGDTWMRAYNSKIRLASGLALVCILFAFRDLILNP
jgi:D-alanyl-lipoteichoic acid acyltransferase DltB (MBOAT superfamily)